MAERNDDAELAAALADVLDDLLVAAQTDFNSQLGRTTDRLVQIAEQAADLPALAERLARALLAELDAAIERRWTTEWLMRLLAAICDVGRRLRAPGFSPALVTRANALAEHDPLEALADAQLAQQMLAGQPLDHQAAALVPMGYAYVALERFQEAHDVFLAAHAQLPSGPGRDELELPLTVLKANLGDPAAGARWGWAAVDRAVQQGGTPQPELVELAFDLQISLLREAVDRPAPNETVLEATGPLERHYDRCPSTISRAGLSGTIARAYALAGQRTDAERWIDESERRCGPADGNVRAELAVMRVEVAVHNGELEAGARLLKLAAPLVRDHGDAELRHRWQGYADSLDFRLDAPVPPGGLPAADAEQQMRRTMRRVMVAIHRGERSDQLERDLVAVADEARGRGLLQFVYGALLVAGPLAGALGAHDRAGSHLRQARAALDEAETWASGQFHVATASFSLELLELGLEVPAAPERQLDRIAAVRDRELCAGRRLHAAVCSMLIAGGALQFDLDPRLASDAAVDAYLILELDRRSRSSSSERISLADAYAAAPALALSAAERLGNDALLAELIESMRSHGMPVARVAVPPEEMSVDRLLQLVALSAAGAGGPTTEGVADSSRPLDEEVLLGWSSDVVMPWGGLALAKHVERTSTGVDGRRRGVAGPVVVRLTTRDGPSPLVAGPHA